jgi:O-acetyl-ADP-ribose deacetylase (regulator of RNase III)
MRTLTIARTLLELTKGDITTVRADAIVNAANASLADGAIHRAGGPAIMAECRAMAGCPTGSAVVTGAGNLAARFVIHAVAPRYSGSSRDATLLRGAYETSLRLARERALRSIALPSLGTGAYRYPIEDAARIALRAVREHAVAGTTLERVTFVLFSVGDLDAYELALGELAET